MGVEIIVSVDEGWLGRMDEVAAELEAIGMKVEHRMPSVGVISGEAAESLMSAIQAVEGVDDVEASRPIRLPPPDSPVQ